MSSWIRGYLSKLSLRQQLVISFFIAQIIIIVILTWDKSPLHYLGLNERSTIYLSYNILIFAFMEGYSTWIQSIQFDKRNRIEDARNELEKAYGPIYLIVKKDRRTFYKEEHIKGSISKVELCTLLEDEMNEINNKLANFPFMFPDEIYDFWFNYIHDIQPIKVLYTFHYDIPYDFILMLRVEYELRVSNYKKLLKK